VKLFEIIKYMILIFFIIACSAQNHVQDSDSRMKNSQELEQSFKPDTSPFVLGVGDEITISVWRNDDLGRSVTVDPQGNIHLPLVGEILVSGMTVSELEEAVTLRLSKYLIRPVVDINVSSVESLKYYIFGEVASPGMFRFKEKSNIMGGIIQAGGFNKTTADLKKVILLRKTQEVYRTKALNLDIPEITQKLDISEITQSPQTDFSTQLESGDIVYVLPKQISNFERFMQTFNNIITPIVNLERAVVMWPDVKSVLKTGKTVSQDATGAIVPP
jgi:polysaccharide export outer membrane protein